MSAKVKPKRGRPTLYTDEIATEILHRMAEGESLRAVCKDEHLPSAGTVSTWAIDDKPPGFSKRYARARALLCEHWADEQVEIADSSGDVQRDRLRIDTRKWLLSKLRPEEYGDRTKLEHSGELGGVMLVPSGVNPDEWSKAARDQQAALGSDDE